MVNNDITDVETLHKKRIAFMIIIDKINYLYNSHLGHKEWYESLGLPIEHFNNIVRGYAKDNKIVYYKGDFMVDDEVIEVALKTYQTIANDLSMNNPNVYCGVIKGEIGEEWPPMYQLNLEGENNILTKKRCC